MLTESQEQQLVIQWADLIPQISGRLLAIPNGANKSMTARMRFKREGLRPGVPDLFLPIPNKHYHGLWIEMKRMKGSTTSLQQHDWIEFLQEQNYQATICRGADEAIAVIQEYLSSVFEINYWQDL